MKVEFAVVEETEKAVLADVSLRNFGNTLKWLPKSAIKFETYVATLNPCTNEPETYGKRVVECADWLVKKLK